MDISSVITVCVIVAFSWYLILSTQSYNRNKKRLLTQGPKQVIVSLFEILDADTSQGGAQTKPHNHDLPDALLDLATNLRIALRVWGYLERYGEIPLEVDCHECFVDGEGNLTHYIVIVRYTKPDDERITTLLHVDAQRLSEHVIQSDAHVHILHTMFNA